MPDDKQERRRTRIKDDPLFKAAREAIKRKEEERMPAMMEEAKKFWQQAERKRKREIAKENTAFVPLPPDHPLCTEEGRRLMQEDPAEFHVRWYNYDRQERGHPPFSESEEREVREWAKGQDWTDIIAARRKAKPVPHQR